MRPQTVLAILCIALLPAGSGAGAGADANEAGKAPFEVPLPRVGDRGTYEFRGWFDKDVSFAWLPPERVVTAEGQAVTANRVFVEPFGGDAVGWLFAYRAGDWKPLLWRYLQDDDIRGHELDELDLFPYEVRGLAEISLWENGSLPYLPHCGAVHPAQGGFLHAAQCFPGNWGDGRSPPARHVVLDGGTTTDGARILVVDTYRRTDASPEMRSWFLEGLPYPFRMEFGPLGTPSLVAVLTAYERGHAPVATDPAPAPPSGPLEIALAEPHGPAGTLGLDFEAADAHRLLMHDGEGERWRAWMEDHPDAYAAGLSRHTNIEDDATTDTWSFDWTDGESMLSTAVAQTRHDDPLGLDRTTHAVRYHGSSAARSVPLPDEAPSLLPTVQGMQEWLRGAEARPTPNGWGFSIGCGEAAGQEGCVAEVEAWLSRSIHTTEGLFGRDATAEWDRIVFADGRLVERRRSSSGLGHGFADIPAFKPAGVDPEPPVAAFPAPAAQRPSAVVVAGGLTLLSLALAALAWAYKAPVLSLFSRVRRDELLAHPLRQCIHAAVEATPGIHYKELVRTVGWGHGGIEHHLEKLVRGGLVLRQKGQGYTCYFPRGTRRQELPRAAASKAPAARGVLAAARALPGANLSEIASRTGMSVQRVSYHVKRLRAAGALEARREAGSLRLWPA